MTEKIDDSLKKNKCKKIEGSDKILNLFNTAGIFLMANTGTLGIIKAIGALHSNQHNPYTTQQIIMESSTVLISTVIIFLNTVANKIGKSKKHEELILKVDDFYEKKKIEEEQKRRILSASKMANNLSFVISTLTSLLTIIFLALSIFALLQNFYGNTRKAAVINIVAYILYVLSVLLIFINKIIGDILQARMEKRYLNI